MHFRLNSNLHYQPEEVEFNGSAYHTGGLGEIYYGRANFCLNGYMQHLVPRDGFETTNSFDKLIFGIIVPKAGNEPIVTNLFHTLTFKSWTACILSLIFVIFVLKCLLWTREKMIVNPIKNTSLRNVPILMYQSFLGESIGNCVPFAYSIRSIFDFWFFYSYLMTTAFHGQLKSALVQPKPLKDIDTLDELLQSNIKIFVFKPNINLIERNVGPELWPKFNRNIVYGSCYNFERQFLDNPDKAHVASSFYLYIFWIVCNQQDI